MSRSSPSKVRQTLAQLCALAAVALSAETCGNSTTGPSVGQPAQSTDANGRDAFTGLVAGTDSLSASQTVSATQTKTVTLTNPDTTVNFDLLPNRSAALKATGPLTFDLRSDGTYLAHGSAAQTGDACASNISGVTTLFDSSNQTIVSMPWSYPNLVSRLGFFRYDPCCAAAAQMTAFQNGGTYTTTFSFTNVYGSTLQC